MYSKITVIFNPIHIENIEKTLQTSGHWCFTLKEVGGRDHSSSTIDKYQLQTLMQLEVYLPSSKKETLTKALLETLNIGGDEETLIAVCPIEELYINGNKLD